jgi:transcriptional regulator with XRE-family HTH domain
MTLDQSANSVVRPNAPDLLPAVFGAANNPVGLCMILTGTPQSVRRATTVAYATPASGKKTGHRQDWALDTRGEVLLAPAPGDQAVGTAGDKWRAGSKVPGVATAGEITRDQVEQAFRKLGRCLKALRQEAELTQVRLAELVRYSRSTVANVEAGRQSITRDFWERADREVRAKGTLLASFDVAIELLRVRQAREAQRELQRRQLRAAAQRSAEDQALGELHAAEAAMGLGGGLNLTITPTGSGGVRLVIEVGPPVPPDAPAVPPTGGARIYSFAQARLAREHRSA